MLYVLQNLHWFLLLIGALVFFHELGHFLFAKLFHVRVVQFSIGFGPKLLSFTHGDTEYRIGILPLGGYVRMLGQDPSEAVAEHEKSKSFAHKTVWQRSQMLFAGPGFNFLLAFVVYWVLSAGLQTLPDTKIGLVSRDGPAWQAGLRSGDKILTAGGNPITSWSVLRQHVGSRAGHSIPLTYSRLGNTIKTQVTPKRVFETDILKREQQRGRIGVSLQYILPKVAVVDPLSPAAQAGIQNGDKVLSVGIGTDKIPVNSWHQLRAAIAQQLKSSASTQQRSFTLTVERQGKTLPPFIIAEHFTEVTLSPTSLPQNIFSNADFGSNHHSNPPFYTGLVSLDSIVHKVEPNTPAAASGILPGDRLIAITIKTPSSTTSTTRLIDAWELDLSALSGADARSHFVFTLQRQRHILKIPLQLEEREETDALKNSYTRYVFGATHDRTAVSTYTVERTIGILEAAHFAGKRLWADMGLIASSIGMMVQGTLPMESMGGPILLFVIAEKSAKHGWRTFLANMAMISVNLGLLNLLPIPVLDGGHLLFCALEIIRRRPPSPQIREWAQLVGLAMLLLMMVMVFKNDILKFMWG